MLVFVLVFVFVFILFCHGLGVGLDLVFVFVLFVVLSWSKFFSKSQIEIIYPVPGFGFDVGLSLDCFQR